MLALFIVAQSTYAAILLSSGRYSHAIRIWDGGVFLGIASNGYPSMTEIAADSGQLAWYAFLPGYPLVIRVVALTGTPVAAAAVVVSVLSAAAGLALIVSLVEVHVGRGPGMAVGTWLAIFPAAPILQVSYSEGLTLLLLSLCFKFALERRALVFGVCMVSLSLVRPIGPALVLTLVLTAVISWRAGGAWRWWLGLAGASAGAALIWPICVGVRTGQMGAYFAAESLWVVPGGPRTWLGAALEFPVAAVVILLVLGASVVAGFYMPPNTPTLLRAWSVAYPLFLFGAATVSTSLVRFMLFAFTSAIPLAGAWTHRLGRVSVLIAIGCSVFLSWFWLVDVYATGTAHLFP